MSSVVALKVEQAPATIDELVEAINSELELADASDSEAARLEQEGEDHRLAAGGMLVELRRRVEAEGGDWWRWIEGRISRSRKDIERLMRLALADDPEAAVEQERAQARDRMARHRSIGANKRNVRSKLDHAVVPFVAQFDIIEAAAEALEEHGWLAVVSEVSPDRMRKLGARLISAADRAEAGARGKVALH